MQLTTNGKLLLIKNGIFNRSQDNMNKNKKS
jgi:hypothetical protein